jgi:hypothetical protein
MCLRSLRRAQPVDLTLDFPSAASRIPSTSEISGQNSATKTLENGVFSKALVAGCGEARQPILAIGRTGDSPARRIATLTMVRIPPRPTCRRNLRCSAILYGPSRRRVRNDVTLVTDATAASGSDGMKAAATNAPMDHRSIDVAASHCERLSAPPRACLFIPYQSRDTVCVRTATLRRFC